MDARVALGKVNDALWSITDEVTPAACDHLVLALDYTAKALARYVGNDATATIMRDVRIFSVLAVTQHTLHRHTGASPELLARLEADITEVIQHQQDNDLNQRMRDRATCRSTNPPTPRPEPLTTS